MTKIKVQFNLSVIVDMHVRVNKTYQTGTILGNACSIIPDFFYILIGEIIGCLGALEADSGLRHSRL